MFKAINHLGLLPAFVVLAVYIPVSGQHPIDNVVVTGDVTNVVLCSRQDDARVYKITIKLHAKNGGTEPVIISGADGMTDFYKIANTLQDLQDTKYTHIGWVTSGSRDPKSVPSTPAKPFRVVAPHARVDINVDLRHVVIGELKPGSTYIELIAENWPHYSDSYTRRLRQAWKKHGILWAHSLHSEPITFVVPSVVKRAHCP
jgi:hypothetical protein